MREEPNPGGLFGRIGSNARTAEIGCSHRRKVRTKSHCSDLRPAQEAVPGLPPLSPPERNLAEEDPRQDLLLRSLGPDSQQARDRHIEGDGWKEALKKYKAVADDLHAGRTPHVKGDGLTVADLCNRFLTAKLRKQTAGEIGARMFQDYKEITDLIVAAFGKTRLVENLAGDDFEKLQPYVKALGAGATR